MKQPNGEYFEISVGNDAYKRPFDLALLLFAHILLLPFWILLWTLIPILIWLGDRGPIFFSQRRSGKNGRVFIVHKFRTMIPNADSQGPAWTIDGDFRLTRVGKILRRTALDELPELWSVLKGDMSFVGPRPLGESEQKQLEGQIPGFYQRLVVRPGLTGLAQVYDSIDSASNKFKYDVEYIGQMSPWLDGKLILLSILNSLGAQWDSRAGKPVESPDVLPDSKTDHLQD
jgi:lipopolysaccharide/colanic/teichoic acid biosynthesis glycosyltransferase